MKARPPRPTDIVALVTFEGHVFPNEAKTRDHLGKDDAAPHPLGPALEQWFSFATGRHTWISVKGNTIRGLVAARERGNRRAWEIDCLIIVDTDDGSVGLSLLDQVAADAGRARVQRVFLRLEETSPLLSTAQRAGFVPYLEETLYRAEELAVRSGPTDEAETVPLRKRTKADTYPLFRLYNSVVPYTVRRAEAMTLEEWVAAQEHNWLPRRTGDFVLESDGEVIGWLRLAEDGQAGRFDLMVHPAHHEVMDALIERALAQLSGQHPIFCLIPTHASDLADRLETRGFRPAGRYLVLVRRTVVPLTVKRAVPAKLRLIQPVQLLRSQRRTLLPLHR